MRRNGYEKVLGLLRSEVIPLGGMGTSKLLDYEIEQAFTDAYFETSVNQFSLKHLLLSTNPKASVRDRAVLFGLVWNPLFPRYMDEVLTYRYVRCYLPMLPIPENIMAGLVKKADPYVLEGVAVAVYPLTAKVQKKFFVHNAAEVKDALVWLARRNDLTEDSQKRLALEPHYAIAARILVNPNVAEEYKTLAALNLQGQGFSASEIASWGSYDEYEKLSPVSISLC